MKTSSLLCFLQIILLIRHYKSLRNKGIKFHHHSIIPATMWKIIMINLNNKLIFKEIHIKRGKDDDKNYHNIKM